MFLDSRQQALGAYFSNILHLQNKLNYDLRPWENYFKKQAIIEEKKEESKEKEQKAQQIQREESEVSE